MSLRKKLIVSSFWSLAATLASLFSGFVVFSILARLLQPAEFGIVSFAVIFVELARVIMAAGIPEALIQRSSWDETTASTAFWANITSSALLAMLMTGAGAVLILYGSSVLGAVFMTLAGGLIIDGARAVHEAKLRREFGYKELALRSVAANVTAGIVGIIMAVQGFGVWALVTSRLVSTTMRTFVIWYSLPWRPRLAFSMTELRSLSRFGGSLLFARTLAEFSKRVPELAIGFILGPAALATYRVGVRGLEFLHQISVTPLTSTALSALSRLDRCAVGDAYVRITSATSLVTFPVFLGAAVVAPDFVMLCFGEKWASSASVMTAMAIGVVPSILVYFAGAALVATGKARSVVVSSLAQLIANTLVALVAVPFGIVMTAIGLAVRGHLSAALTLIILRKDVGLPVKRMIKALIGPSAAAGVMALSVAAVRMFLLNDTQPLVRLLASSALGCVVYMVLLFALAPSYTARTLKELLPFLPSKLKGVGIFLIKRL